MTSVRPTGSTPLGWSIDRAGLLVDLHTSIVEWESVDGATSATASAYGGQCVLDMITEIKRPRRHCWEV